MDLMETFQGNLSRRTKSNQFKLMIEGSLKGKTMAKGLLTEIDKQWIADLITTSISTAIKQLQADIQILKEDMKNVKEDVKNLNDDVKAIKTCPTIKK